MQKVFRCAHCKRGMRIVGSTGLAKEVAKAGVCPYCKARILVKWPRGDTFWVQRIATR
jgi:DNA-directed RNA polymerase subunit RPC12/RpoP